MNPKPEAHARVAVVTGANSGIGEPTARTLAAQSFHVVAVAHRADRLRRLADEIGGSAIAALEVYDGGAGYCAAKHDHAALHRTLRGELLGTPVRLVRARSRPEPVPAPG